MSSTGSFRVVFGALMLLLSSVAAAAPKLAISPLGYRVVQATPVAGTTNQFELTARAGVFNSGDAATNVTARIASSTPTIVVVDGNVQFGNVGLTSLQRPVISSDTFKLRVITPQRPTLQNILQFAQTAMNSLSWSIQCATCGQNRPPIANAGSNKTAFVAVPIIVSGAASTDPDGNALTFRWSLTSRPEGSAAALTSTTSVETSLTPDRDGSYVLQLIVNDGAVDSASSSMTVTTLNSAPVALAGPDQSAAIGARVTLNGSGSTDSDGDSLSYAWRLVDKPDLSSAALLSPAAASPVVDFVVDRPGQYIAELIVGDGAANSAPDSLTVSTLNSIPIANAGPDQTIGRGVTARLSGVDSRDADGDSLSYRWSLTTPTGSQATLLSANAMDTGFLVDRPGVYIVQLIVSDGVTDSTADTAVVSTVNSAPVANAGIDLRGQVGDAVLLDGLQSRDADDDALAFSWSLLARPPSSKAELGLADTPRASFIPDLPGLYVAQLIVNDSRVDSAPDTVQVVVETRADTVPPVISIDSPPDRSYVNTATVILKGQVSEPSSFVVNGQTAPLNALNEFLVAVPLNEGVNSIPLSATDASGNQATMLWSVARDSQAPLAADLTRIVASRAANSQVLVAGAAGSVEPGTQILIINQTSGVTSLTFASPNGSFEGSIAAQPTDILAVRVVDAAGNQSADRQLPLPASCNLDISVSQPAGGDAIASRYVVVAGTVTGTSDAGVVVNQILAATRPDGENTVFVARVRLESGSNLITIAASTLTGQRIERTLQVTRGEVPIVEVTSNLSGGLAPLSVDFDIQRFAQAMVVQATYDFDGDGLVDKTVLFPEDPETFVYTQPGEYSARVELILAGQPPREWVIPISVMSTEQLDAKLRSIWDRLKTSLLAQDLQSVASVFSLGVREKYAQVLAEYGDDLPWFVGGLSGLTQSMIGFEYSEYALVRMLDGQRMVYFVAFVRDPDGIWRIVGM